jgi:hypothetical protein
LDLFEAEMEEFKNINDINEPDERNTAYALYDHELKGFLPYTLADHYAYLDSINININVPEDIKNSFIIAKNIMLYSWHVYPFVVVSDLYVMASLEYAIKYRIDNCSQSEGWGLKKCMDYIIEKGWIKDEGIIEENMSVKNEIALLEQYGLLKEVNIVSIDPQSYVKKLATALPPMRNELAHGTPMIYPGGYSKLKLVSKIINQLWSA